jgi:hypothetical protein
VLGMRLSLSLIIAGPAVATLCLCAQTPNAQPERQALNPSKVESINEIPGLTPRATPADYPVQTKVGPVTIAAEFAGHGIPTREGALSTEDYVVVEIAFYGAPGTRFPLSLNDFALRINGKKNPAPSEPFERLAYSVKDPEWAPPQKAESSKTSIGGGGASLGGGDDSSKEVRVPPELQRAMALRVKKASLPEGERPLPQAGLLYFPYGGKVKGIRSLELIYSGSAGKTTIDLQP